MERAAHQADLDQLRWLSAIFSLEALLDTVIVDEDRGAIDVAIAQLHLGATAPGQELRVALDIVDQRVHALRGYPTSTDFSTSAMGLRGAPRSRGS